MLRSEELETDRQLSTLFPLPFTPFEYYYYLDDCEQYPTAFPVELQFSGRLSRERFADALARAVARHPMLAAVVDDRGRRPVWVADKRGEPFVDWADHQVAISHPRGEYIDLRHESGLRTWVRAAPDRARVLFQIHHACCDGLSAMQFLADFLACYKLADGHDAILRDLDPDLLHRRGQIVGDDAERSLSTGLRDVMVTARVWRRILFRTPEVLAAPAGRSSPTQGSEDILSYETEKLAADETSALRELAKSHGATANDLLLRDFLLVLRAWNRQQAGSSKGRLRVNVPVNVRRRDEMRMPAANRIGFGFPTAEGRLGDDPDKLLEAVRAEMQRIKDWKLGLYFLGGLELGSSLPGALPWALRRQKSLATAVLSNVGRFAPEPKRARDERWQCNDLVLERITGVPPVRKLTRAAVIVIEYGGETSICLRCDPHYFDRDDTRALLSAYTQRVRETLRRGN